MQSSSSSSSSSVNHTADSISLSLISAQEGDADGALSSNSSAVTAATKIVRCHSGSRCRSVDKIDGAGNHSVNSDIPVDHSWRCPLCAEEELQRTTSASRIHRKPCLG